MIVCCSEIMVGGVRRSMPLQISGKEKYGEMGGQRCYTNTALSLGGIRGLSLTM